MNIALRVYLRWRGELGISIGELIKRGFLVPPRVFAPSEQIDLSGIRVTSSGDFNKQALAECMDKPGLAGNAVRQYRKVCYGKPAVAWCVNSHAEQRRYRCQH